MAILSPAKANHLLVTGVLQVLLGSATFALVYVLYGDTFNVKGEILSKAAAYWTSIPIIVVGLGGVLAGITKKPCAVNLYLVGSTGSCIMGGFVCITVGIKVNEIRTACGEDSDCKNSSLAMLLGTLVLMASLVVSIALWGAVKACQATWGPSKKTKRVRAVGEYHVDGASVENDEPPMTSVAMVNQAAQPDPPRDTPGSDDHEGGVVNVVVDTRRYDDSHSTKDGNPSADVGGPSIEIDSPSTEDVRPSEVSTNDNDSPESGTDDKPREGGEEESTNDQSNEKASTGAKNTAYEDDDSLLTYL